MTLGTGIFLAALLLSGAYLVVSTLDRWRWKRIVLVFVLITLALVSSIAAYVYFSSKPVGPTFQAELSSIPIGADEAEVSFRRGEPNLKKQARSGGELWLYREDRGATVAGFRNGKVTYVAFQPVEAEVIFKTFLGVSMGDSSAAMLERLGQPTAMTPSPHGLQRIYSFDQYGSFFLLEKDQVTGWGIYALAAGPLVFCDPANSLPLSENVPERTQFCREQSGPWEAYQRD